MKLPEQIPKSLREMAVVLPDFEEGEGAWAKDDALAVIDGLKGTTVAISDVVMWTKALWGYAPSDLALSIERLPNEADADYAGRSRAAAGGFIRQSESSEVAPLFALTFPILKDAA